MKHPIPRSLAAIACIYGAILPHTLAYAQESRTSYYNTLPPISRDGLGYINQLGGGVDDQGYYHQPVKTQEAYGTQLPNGTYEAPMQWDSDNSILFDVQDGVIYKQDYRLGNNTAGGQH